MKKPLYYHRIWKNRAGRWFWTLFARNGKKVATTGEGYARRAHAERMVFRLFGSVLALLLLAACTVDHPPIVHPQQPPPDAFLQAVYADCDAVYRDLLGRSADEGAKAGCLSDALAQVSDWQGKLKEFIRGSEEYAARNAHYDPSDVPLEQLARIRGAMWTETWPCSLGPRPWQPNNVCATDFLWNYPEDQRLQIVQNLTGLGYTHAVNGPLVDSDGYHGAWTPRDWRGSNFDKFLDMLQFEWDHGLAPVVYITPDNWSLDRAKAELTPLLQQPRAQKLIRIAVRAWEPCKYECSSYTWAEYGKWLRETLPNALILLHTVCDVDAPVGTDALGDDNGKDNAIGWQRVAPFYHGWLTQSCTFERADGVDDQGRSNFQNWVDLFNPRVRGSYQDRFQHGYAGWPTSSAWGASRPLKVYAAEYFAFPVTWQKYTSRPMTAEEARRWGDAAMRAGADGYLDGGTLPVGDGDVPWRR